MGSEILTEDERRAVAEVRSWLDSEQELDVARAVLSLAAKVEALSKQLTSHAMEMRESIAADIEQWGADSYSSEFADACRRIAESIRKLTP
jgi:hypothetical protein